MGCNQSAIILSNLNIYSTNYEIFKFKPQFKVLGLDEATIGILHYHFKKIDVSGDGLVSLQEISVILDLEEHDSKFSKKVFGAYDIGKSGQLTFREFVFSVWNFCSLSPRLMPLFVFTIYDINANLRLSHSEVLTLLEDIYSVKAETPMAVSMKETLEGINEKHFDIVKFRQICAKYPKLLFPVQLLQDHIKTRLIGKSVWENHAIVREKNCPKYLSVKAYMKKFGGETIFNDFLLSERSIKEDKSDQPGAESLESSKSFVSVKEAEEDIDSDKVKKKGKKGEEEEEEDVDSDKVKKKKKKKKKGGSKNSVASSGSTKELEEVIQDYEEITRNQSAKIIQRKHRSNSKKKHDNKDGPDTYTDKILERKEQKMKAVRQERALREKHAMEAVAIKVGAYVPSSASEVSSPSRSSSNSVSSNHMIKSK